MPDLPPTHFFSLFFWKPYNHAKSTKSIDLDTFHDNFRWYLRSRRTPRSSTTHTERPRMFSRNLNKSQTETVSRSRRDKKAKSSFRDHAVSKNKQERSFRKPPTEEGPPLGRYA